MKKILLFASALAGLFLAGCQRENLEPVQAGQQVTFTIEAPAAMQTKAIADGQNVDQLVYEVWLTPTLGNLETSAGAQKLYQGLADMVSDGTTNKAELTLDLVNDQKFTVLFWAQVAHTYDMSPKSRPVRNPTMRRTRHHNPPHRHRPSSAR